MHLRTIGYTALNPHSRLQNPSPQKFPETLVDPPPPKPYVDPYQKQPNPQTPNPILFVKQRKTPKFPQEHFSPSRDPISGGVTRVPLL
jgi:hypothetical protein